EEEEVRMIIVDQESNGGILNQYEVVDDQTEANAGEYKNYDNYYYQFEFFYQLPDQFNYEGYIGSGEWELDLLLLFSCICTGGELEEGIEGLYYGDGQNAVTNGDPYELRYQDYYDDYQEDECDNNFDYEEDNDQLDYYQDYYQFDLDEKEGNVGSEGNEGNELRNELDNDFDCGS
ncbi:MAG: hypothetical protein EZS28_002376, partial [Streblomastix strix]